MKKILLSALCCSMNMAFAAGVTHYDVWPVSQAPDLDKPYNAQYWQNIPVIEGGFHYPWRDIPAPQTVFKAVHDNDSLYLVFTAKDKEIVVSDAWEGEKPTVSKEDRVEIFFAPSAIDVVAKSLQEPGNPPTIKYALPYYYAIEADPKGRVHDYRAKFYRQLDSDWNMEGLKTVGQIEDGQYIVRMKIPLKILKDLDLLKDNGRLKAGLFRAEFSKDVNSKNGLDMRWISWVNPNTPLPDFHVNDAFGELRLLPAEK